MALAVRDPEAATPILLAALEDDFARDAARAGLRGRGVDARDAPVEAVLDPGSGWEPSLRRRRAAADLLLEIGIDVDAWRRLECALDEADAQLVCAVGLLGMECSPDPARIARRPVEILPSVGWEWLQTVEDVMVGCAIRAGSDTPLPSSLEGDRLDVLLGWRRICRRIAAARERR